MNDIPTVFQEVLDEAKKESVIVEIMGCLLELNKSLCLQEKEIKRLFDGLKELASVIQSMNNNMQLMNKNMKLMNEAMQLMDEKLDKIIGENSEDG